MSKPLLSNAQLAFIVIAVFNAIGGAWVLYDGDRAGLMNLFVACLMLISARQA